MVAVGAAFLVVALVVSVGAGLLQYALVRAEHDEREVIGRDQAKRRARRDVDGRSE